MDFEPYRPRRETFDELQLAEERREKRAWARSKQVESEHIADSARSRISASGSVNYQDFTYGRVAVMTRSKLDEQNYRERVALPSLYRTEPMPNGKRFIPFLSAITSRILSTNFQDESLFSSLNSRNSILMKPILKEIEMQLKGFELPFQIWLQTATKLSFFYPKFRRTYKGLVLEDLTELNLIILQNEVRMKEWQVAEMNRLEKEKEGIFLEGIRMEGFIIGYLDLSNCNLEDGDMLKLKSIAPFLVVLKLNDNRKITNGGISSMMSAYGGSDGFYEKLEVLCLKNLPRINDFMATKNKLSKLLGLRILDLRGTACSYTFMNELESLSLNSIAWQQADFQNEYENKNIEFQLFGPSFTASKLITELRNLSAWVNDPTSEKNAHEFIDKPMGIQIKALKRVDLSRAALTDSMFSMRTPLEESEYKAHHKSYGTIYATKPIALGQLEQDGANEIGGGRAGRDEIAGGAYSGRGRSLYEIGNQKLTKDYDEAFSDLGSEGEAELIEREKRAVAEDLLLPRFYQQPNRKKRSPISVRTEEFDPLMLIRHLPISVPFLKGEGEEMESQWTQSQTPIPIPEPEIYRRPFEPYQVPTIPKKRPVELAEDILFEFVTKKKGPAKLKVKPLPIVPKFNPFSKKGVVRPVQARVVVPVEEEGNGNLKRRANLSAFAKSK